jgi:hypothetical protein
MWSDAVIILMMDGSIVMLLSSKTPHEVATASCKLAAYMTSTAGCSTAPVHAPYRRQGVLSRGIMCLSGENPMDIGFIRLGSWIIPQIRLSIDKPGIT